MSTLSDQYLSIIVYTTTSEAEALALMLGLDLTKNQSPLPFKYEKKEDPTITTLPVMLVPPLPPETAYLKIEEVHIERDNALFPQVDRFYVIVKGKVL